MTKNGGILLVYSSDMNFSELTLGTFGKNEFQVSRSSSANFSYPNVFCREFISELYLVMISDFLVNIHLTASLDFNYENIFSRFIREVII